MQEPCLAYPPLLIDENAVHDRNLPGRATETQQRHAHPYAHGFAEGHAVIRRWDRGCIGSNRAGHELSVCCHPPRFTLARSSAARSPCASFCTSSFAQKCMKKRCGESSIMWL